MEYFIWEADKEAGQALIYGGWPALPISFSTGDLISVPVPAIEIKMNEKSQGFMTDNLLVMGAPPVFSDKMISILKDAGVDNLQTFPCRIINTVTGESHYNYRVVNVVGKIACLNKDNSEIDFADSEQTRILAWEYLTLDESKTLGQLFFVLAEMPVQIVIHKSVSSRLQDAGISGVAFTPQGDPMEGFPSIK